MMASFAAVLMVVTAAAAPIAGTKPAAGIYGTSSKLALMYQYTNGTSRQLGPGVANEAQTQQLSALDAARGVYYILGWNYTAQAPNLLGFSISDGNMVSQAQLPFVEGAFVGLGQYLSIEQPSGRVIVAGQLKADGPNVIGFVDPRSGKFDQVAALNASLQPVLGGCADYDPATGTFLAAYGQGEEEYIYSVNMSSGGWTRWGENFVKGQDIQSLDYDSSSGAFYGLGLAANGTGYVRNLVRLDARNYSYSIVGPVEGYLVMSGPVAALDAARRVLYWVGQRSNAGAQDPFFLIGVSLDTAAVVSSAQLCASDDQCPWSLEFYAG